MYSLFFKNVFLCLKLGSRVTIIPLETAVLCVGEAHIGRVPWAQSPQTGRLGVSLSSCSGSHSLSLLHSIAVTNYTASQHITVG